MYTNDYTKPVNSPSDTETIVVTLTRQYHPTDLGEPTAILENAIRAAYNWGYINGRKAAMIEQVVATTV